MAKYNSIQNSLIGGELTPLARGRTDLKSYYNSVDTMRNQIPLISGGSKRRPGSWFGAKVGSSSGQINLSSSYTRQIPWEFSDGTRFIVALGGSQNLKVFDVTTNAPDDDNTPADNDFYLNLINTISFPTPPTYSFYDYSFTDTQAREAQYCQIGDLLIITRKDKHPVYLSRGSGSARFVPTTYEIRITGPVTAHAWFHGGSSEDQYKNVPYMPVGFTNGGVYTLTPSATTGGNKTLTANAAFFHTGHVGAMFKLNSGACIVTQYTSTTVVKIDILDDFAATTASSAFEESAWSDYRGWPRSISYFQGRLVYGGSAFLPDTLWFSQSGDIFEFTPTIGASAAATDAFSAVSNCADKANLINWQSSSGKNLAFGTNRDEFLVTVPDVSAGFSASNIAISKETSRGSSYRMPLRTEAALYFVDAEGQRIVEFVFDQRENNYRNRDINIFAQHIFAKFQAERSTPRSEPKILSIHKQSSSDDLLWVLDDAGGLFSCTIDRAMDITAWAYHYLGGHGTGDNADPAPLVSSVCTVNSILDGYDYLWLLVSRSINNSTVIYSEYIKKALVDESDYLDCKILSLQSPGTTVAALGHLNGEVIGVVADGLDIGDKTVSSSQITLATAAALIITGFRFSSKIISLPVEAGSQVGSGKGTIGRIDQARVHFYRSANANIGSLAQDTADTLEEVSFRDSSLASSTPTPLFTGYKVLDLAEDYERENQVVIETDGALGMNVTHFTLRGLLYD